MKSMFSPARLAQASANYPWVVIAIWAVLIAGGLVAAGHLVINDSREVIGSDSHRAANLLEERFRGPRVPVETIVVSSPTLDVDDPAFRGHVERLTAEVRAMEGVVVSVANYYETGNPGFLARDRHSTLVAVALEGDVIDARKTVLPVVKAAEHAARDGFSVHLIGDGSLAHDMKSSAESDLMRGEAIGLSAALIILLIVFGAAVAAGLPILLGILGILFAVGLTALVSQVSGVSTYTVNMITMIGLAVGIDYTLFIVERYREERRNGLAKDGAILVAANTASRAVAFSGGTVVIAVSSLFIVPSAFFRGLSIGAITAVTGAVLLALTLLPALLSLLGDRVDRLSLPGRRPRTGESGGAFEWAARQVTRRPLLAAVSATALLLAAAAPYLTIRMGFPGIAEMPGHLTSVRAFETIQQDFAAGKVDPVEIVIVGDASSPTVAAAVEQFRNTVASDPAFASVEPAETSADDTITLVSAYLAVDILGSEGQEAVKRLRSEIVPVVFGGTGAEVRVGGRTAEVTDEVTTMSRYLPVVVGFVLLLSFVLLLLVFRSIVIPLKAIVMNLLSVGAAYGLLVLVFQHGVGADVLGFRQVDAVAAFIPPLLFAVLFGLSMDYHVFLLSRVQERFRETGDNTAAVAHGLRSTAHIITGAAAIMLAVFGGFALGDLTELQQVGFGLSVAVFLDATIVRIVLVPASMQLLGDRNWYFPAWLEWLPVLDVEGRRVRVPAPAKARAGWVGGTPATAGK